MPRVKPHDRPPLTAGEVHAMWLRLADLHTAGRTHDFAVRERHPADKPKAHLRSLIEHQRIRAQLALATMESLLRHYHSMYPRGVPDGEAPAPAELGLED